MPSSVSYRQRIPRTRFVWNVNSRGVAAKDAKLSKVTPTELKENHIHMKRYIALPSWTLALIGALAVVALVSPSHAQIAVSANDNKVVNDNGTVKVVPNAPADTVAIIDLNASPPRVVAEVQAPVSVVGPPLSVALTPDEGLALVTSSNKVDPANPTRTVPDNRMSVIDLKASPPKVIATLETGKAPSCRQLLKVTIPLNDT
jgi:hypothetical protein